MKFWALISSIVCDDEADGDLDERKFRALNKYNNNRMGANESQFTFYERFRLLFDNCEMVGSTVHGEDEFRIAENGYLVTINRRSLLRD